YLTKYNGGTQPSYNACISVQGISADVKVSNNTCTDTHTQIASVTNGQATIKNLTNTALFSVGNTVTGADIPGATTVLSIDSPSQITMSANATGTNTNESVVIGTTTMQYGFQGISSVALGTASRALTNINIQTNNTVNGAGTAIFEPAASVHVYDVTLNWGTNYGTAFMVGVTGSI